MRHTNRSFLTYNPTHNDRNTLTDSWACHAINVLHNSDFAARHATVIRQRTFIARDSEPVRHKVFLTSLMQHGAQVSQLSHVACSWGIWHGYSRNYPCGVYDFEVTSDEFTGSAFFVHDGVFDLDVTRSSFPANTFPKRVDAMPNRIPFM